MRKRMEPRGQDGAAPRTSVAPAPARSPAGSGTGALAVGKDVFFGAGQYARAGGEPLREDVRARFEPSLGTDLSAVRVHRSEASAEASAAIGAKAYTVGNEIHLGAGRYQPDTPAGMRLLAHEVAHTVQQRGATPRRPHELEVSRVGDASEREADRAADAMIRGEPAAVGRAHAHIARDHDGKDDPEPYKPDEPTSLDDKKAADPKGHWTPPTADHYPDTSVDPRVLTARPASPAKVWNPPAPDGWRYWPEKQKIPPRGKAMTDEGKTKPLGTFTQEIVDGRLIAARTEWHDGTVLFDEHGNRYVKPGVYQASNLMEPLVQPKTPDEKAQEADRKAKDAAKKEASPPKKASAPHHGNDP